jgi:hypothetical protein
MAEDGKSGTFFTTPAERDEFVRKFVEGHARKGRKVVITKEVVAPLTDLQFGISLEMRPMARALLKIAYLAAFEYLGDAFLDDELNVDWHKAIVLNDPIESTRLRGVAFKTQDFSEFLFPQLQPHEHATVVANLQLGGPVIGVTLFGTGGLHSLIVAPSATTSLGLADGEGQVVVCDAKTRSIRRMTFLDHLQSLSQQRIDLAAEDGNGP